MENKIQEENVYKFIERVGPGITAKMELKDNPGHSSINCLTREGTSTQTPI